MSQPAIQIKVGVNKAIKQDFREANGTVRRARTAHLSCPCNPIYEQNLIYPLVAKVQLHTG